MPTGHSFGEDPRVGGGPRELGHARPHHVQQCSGLCSAADQATHFRCPNHTKLARCQRLRATLFPHESFEDDVYKGYLRLRGMMNAQISIETLRCGGQQGDLTASVCRSASSFPPVCTCEPNSCSLTIACVRSLQRCFSSASYLSPTCRLSRVSRALLVRALRA